MSREHFVSEKILKRFCKSAVEIGGFRWIENDQPRFLPPAALTVNVLCAKHNSALSPLDTEALRLFSAIEEAFSEERANSDLPELLRPVDGRLFERWLLKFLFATLAGRVIALPPTVASDWQPNVTWLRRLFGFEEIPQPLGLYFPHAAESATEGHVFGCRPFANHGELIRADFLLSGIPMQLSVRDTPPTPATYRPRSLKFIKNDRTTTIDFGWPGDIVLFCIE